MCGLVAQRQTCAPSRCKQADRGGPLRTSSSLASLTLEPSRRVEMYRNLTGTNLSPLGYPSSARYSYMHPIARQHPKRAVRNQPAQLELVPIRRREGQHALKLHAILQPLATGSSGYNGLK
mmetsp:Transcript_45686/g.106568  ORF Transcript_45686/g.106568 Transcript_45686/m.106568 type:complete len:121 (-) Transcript_45686:265-627(-)